jgi:hypothetical protein
MSSESDTETKRQMKSREFFCREVILPFLPLTFGSLEEIPRLMLKRAKIDVSSEE